jgi:hypothetical protein
VERLDATGHYDGSFAGGGLTSLPTDGTPAAVAVQADGKILVGGTTTATRWSGG